MMKADLKRASFRDVTFSIESHELECGRRVAIHEYPHSSQCFAEDLGRQKKVFLVNGFVSGRLCRSERDRLLTACEAEGSGDLIHPHYGKKTVVCTGFRVSESALERGIIYFTLSFVESESELESSLIPGFLKDSVAFQAIQGAFEAIGTIADQAQDFAATLGSSVELLESAMGPVFAVHEASTRLQSAIIRIKNDLTNLSLQPQRCMRSLGNLFSLLFDGQKTAAVKTFGLMAPTLTQNRPSELSSALSVLLVATLAQGRLENTTGEDAHQLFEVLEHAMPTLSDDNLYGQAQDLRAQLARFFQDQIQVRTHYISEPTPSLVLCAQLGLPLESESTLLALNSVSNPCLISRGEVLYEPA